MGIPKTHLWELIHALNPQEVQKFKDRSFEYKRGRYANYVRLFDEIMKQDHYDEALLKAHFQGEAWVKNFSRTKNYLYDRVLEYIPDAQQDEETTLHGLLKKLKILIHKRLFHHTPPLLKKARKVAKWIEDFGAQIDLLHLEKSMLLESKNWDRYQERIAAIHSEEIHLLDTEHEVLALTRLRDKMPLVQAGNMKILGQVLSDPLMHQQSYKSARSKIMADSIRFSDRFFAGSYADALLFLRRMIKTYQENPGLIASVTGFKHAVSMIYAASALEIAINSFGAAEETFGLLKDFAKAPKREPTLFLERKTWFEVAIARKNFDVERGLLALEHFQSERRSGKHTFSAAVEIEIAHVASVFLLNYGKPKAALAWIIENRDRSIGKYRPDILHYSKILFLVAHTELENDDVVLRAIKATRQSYSRSGQMNSYTVSILELFARFAKTAGSGQRRQVLKNFLDNLKHGSPDPLWERMQNYFHFTAWVESRLEGLPMSAILKKYF